MFLVALMAVAGGFGSLFFTVPAWGWCAGLIVSPLFGSAIGALAAIHNSFMTTDQPE
jgi:hypothetical protein